MKASQFVRLNKDFIVSAAFGSIPQIVKDRKEEEKSDEDQETEEIIEIPKIYSINTYAEDLTNLREIQNFVLR